MVMVQNMTGMNDRNQGIVDWNRLMKEKVQVDIEGHMI